MLSRKKLNHGRFEDPYKAKVLCWIKQGKFFILPLSPDRTPQGTAPEEINIAASQVLPPFVALAVARQISTVPNAAQWEKEDKGKFSIFRHGADPIKLKADTLADAELWLSHIASTLKKASDPSGSSCHFSEWRSEEGLGGATSTK